MTARPTPISLIFKMGAAGLCSIGVANGTAKRELAAAARAAAAINRRPGEVEVAAGLGVARRAEQRASADGAEEYVFEFHSSDLQLVVGLIMTEPDFDSVNLGARNPLGVRDFVNHLKREKSRVRPKTVRRIERVGLRTIV